MSIPVRSLLALAAPATFWMMIAEPAQAQGPFAEIRCTRLGSDPKMASTRAEPLQELRAQAESDGCDAVVRRIDAQLTRISGGAEIAASRPPQQPDCAMARTLADIALSSNDRTQIRTARESVRGCASESRRLNEWLEAHPEAEGGPPLRALAPWEEYAETGLDSRAGETRYDEFRVRLQHNEGVAIKMRTEAFQPLLAVGTDRMPDFNQIGYAFAPPSEDGRREVVLHFQAPLEGVQDYVVVAAHDGDAGAGGPYTITREPWTPPPPPPPTPVTAGAVMNGEITPETAQRVANSRLVFDTWSYRGRAGERLRINMRSSDFDPYLIFGRMENGEFTQIATDDDGGDGLDSLLRMLLLPDDGEYLIRARSLGGNPGAYTLLVESLPERSTERVSFNDANAWTAQGLLLEDSLTDENGRWYQEFSVRPSRSGTLVARALSSEFTPVVDISELTRDGLTPIDVYSEESARTRGDVTFAAERRKTYVIRVRTDADYGGEFNLVVAEQPED